MYRFNHFSKQCQERFPDRQEGELKKVWKQCRADSLDSSAIALYFVDWAVEDIVAIKSVARMLNTMYSKSIKVEDNKVNEVYTDVLNRGSSKGILYEMHNRRLLSYHKDEAKIQFATDLYNALT